MAAKYGWEENVALGFLRCHTTPSKEMLNDIAKELDLNTGELQRILDR